MFIGYFGSAVTAQSVDVVVADPAVDAKEGFDINTAYAHRFETDLDKDGKFNTNSVRFELNTRTQLTARVGWDNHFFYTFDNYEFEKTGRGGWWKDIHNLTYIPLFRWSIDRSWSVFGAPVVQVAAESGADWGDGVSGGGLVGFLWSPDSSLTLGAGIAAVSRIEDKFGLAPIPLGRWRFADSWILRAGVPEFGARRGFGAELGWEITDSLELAGGAQYQRRRFRLDDDGPASQADGVGDESSLPVYAKLILALGDSGDWEVFGGIALAGTLKIQDKDGGRIEEPPGCNQASPTCFDTTQEFDPAPILGTSLRFQF